MVIYLAGMIIGDKIKECLEWRLHIRKHYLLKGWNLVFLDPLNTKVEYKTITADGLKSEIPAKSLFARDYMGIKNADIVIANLDEFNQKRPPVGTLSEIALAWTMNKPVIVISDKEHYVEHPFIKEFASQIVSSVDELLKQKIIDYYFGGINNAVYNEDVIKEI